MAAHLKRYWLFAGSQYYPDGGMADFVETGDDLEALRVPLDAAASDDHFRYYTRAGKNDHFNWYHIFDSQIGRVIEGCHLSGTYDMDEDLHQFTAVNGEGGLTLKQWLAKNLDSLACVDGAICTADNGSNVSRKTLPEDWLIRNAARVREFIEVWEKHHDGPARPPASP